VAAYVIDSDLFRDQFSTAASRRIFSDRNTVQKWLEVEAALARAEAKLGIIPEAAAVEITRVAHAELYDLDARWCAPWRRIAMTGWASMCTGGRPPRTSWTPG
jgi:hypothetical protein